MVERSPEKAGVGGSIPSLATIVCNYLAPSPYPVLGPFGSNSLLHHLRQAAQFLDDPLLRLGDELLVDVEGCTRARMSHLRLSILHIGTGHF